MHSILSPDAVCTARAGLYKGVECKIDVLGWGAMLQPRSTISVPNVVSCNFKALFFSVAVPLRSDSALSIMYLSELM